MNQNIKVAKELVKLAKYIVSKNITIQNSVIDYIWNRIKHDRSSVPNLGGKAENSKIITLTSKQLQGLFNCDKPLESLDIIIANRTELKNKNIPFWLERAKEHKEDKIRGFYEKRRNFIVIYYPDAAQSDQEERYLSLLDALLETRDKNIFQRNKSFIKNTLKHQLIHYYKNKIVGLSGEVFDSVKDFQKYLNSDTQYDSWISDISLKMVRNIRKIESYGDKISRVYQKNSKNGVAWTTYVKTFLKRNKIEDKFLSFYKNGKKDIIKAIQQKLLYNYKAQYVYNNIDEAKKDVEKNYYYLYKAINKGLIRTNNKVIFEVVKCLLKNNKIECIVTLMKRGKLQNFKDKIQDLFEQYKNNNKIYFRLIQFGLVAQNEQYKQHRFNTKIKSYKEWYQLAEFYSDYINEKQQKKIKILDKAMNTLDQQDKNMFFNKVNTDIDLFGEDDGCFSNYCQQNNIQLDQIQDDDDI